MLKFLSNTAVFSIYFKTLRSIVGGISDAVHGADRPCQVTNYTLETFGVMAPPSHSCDALSLSIIPFPPAHLILNFHEAVHSGLQRPLDAFCLSSSPSDLVTQRRFYYWRRRTNIFYLIS
jgi:hypothetical protein